MRAAPISILLLVAVAIGWTAAAEAALPKCFGAAARDPLRPCDNPRLRLSVVPTPSDAVLVSGPRCTKLKAEGAVVPCAFGPSSARARDHFALVGDSHAAQWRPALDIVARRQRWRGYAITRNNCPLSTVARVIPEPYFSECAAWKPQLVSWLARHPEVSTLFVSQRTPDGDDFGPGPPAFATLVTGHVDAWNQLPPSVTRIFVIRDNPAVPFDTHACVSRALARRRSAGKACAVPRETALPPDPAEAAVAQMASPRVRSIHLSHFFCGVTSCYPVVGGVLVHKDINHITRLFAETLAPFILRDVRQPA